MAPVGERSLRSNFSWTLAGNVVFAASQFGQIVVLSKLLPPEGVGSYAFAFAVTAPVFLLANLQLRPLLATDARREYPFRTYLRLRLLMTAGALTLLLLMAALGGYAGSTRRLIAAVAIAKAIETLSDLCYGVAQRRDRMDRIARSLLLRGPLALVLLAGSVWLTRSVVAGVVAMAAVWAAVLLAHDLRHALAALREETAPASGQPGEAGSTRRLLLLALPMGLVVMLLSLGTNIPRYFIQGTLGEKDLGIFAGIGQLMTTVTLVVNALTESSVPALARDFASGDAARLRARIGRLLGVALALGVLGLAVAAAFGPRILALLYTAAYAERHALLVWIMAASALSSLGGVLGSALTAMRRFRPQLAIHVVNVLLLAAACVVLVPRNGIDGAGIAVVVSTGFLALAYGILTWWSLRALEHTGALAPAAPDKLQA